MTKQFEALLESEVLSEETKAGITEAFNELKESIRNELEVQYAEKQVKKNKELSQKLYEALEERMKSEVEELREDLQRAKGLEVEYAKKLTEFKRDYRTKLNEAIEKKLKVIVTKEFGELRGDLLEAKKNAIGNQIFESIKHQVAEYGLSEKDLNARQKLTETEEKLNKVEKELSEIKRNNLMESLLSNLRGSKREVMRTILENVSIEKLEERYNETVNTLLESKEEEDKKAIDENKKPKGSSVTEIDEVEAARARLRKLVK